MSADPKPLSDAELAELSKKWDRADGWRTTSFNVEQANEYVPRLLATIDALKADARAAKDRNGPLYRELAALKAEKNVPRSGPTPPDLADSPRAEVGISAGPLADDAELIDRLRCGYGSKIKLEVGDFVALDALAMEAGGRLSQRSAALRAVRELCDKHGTGDRRWICDLIRLEMESAK